MLSEQRSFFLAHWAIEFALLCVYGRSLSTGLLTDGINPTERVSCRFVRRGLSEGAPVGGVFASQPTAVVQKRLLRPGWSHQFGLARNNSLTPAKYNDYAIHMCRDPPILSERRPQPEISVGSLRESNMFGPASLLSTRSTGTILKKARLCECP